MRGVVAVGEDTALYALKQHGQHTELRKAMRARRESEALEISTAYPAVDISLGNINLDARTARIKGIISELKNDSGRITLNRVGENKSTSNKKCGKWFTQRKNGKFVAVKPKVVFCAEHPEKSVRKQGVFRCNRRDCPECSPSWAASRGKKIAERLVAAVELYKEQGIKFREVIHVVISPDQKHAKTLLQTEGGEKQLYKEAEEAAVLMGIEGGNMILHHERYNDSKKKTYDASMLDKTWYLSPHFHTVGVYRRLMKSNKFHDKTGWVYKNLGRRRTISGTISYELNHATISYRPLPQHRCFMVPRNFKAREIGVWFGCMSKNYIGKDGKPVKEIKPMLCPECKAQMAEYEAVFAGDGTINFEGCKHIKLAWEDTYPQKYRLLYNPYEAGIIGDPPPFDITLHVPEDDIIE